ncbi:hypothetical protein [Mycobacterium aquaticum]|uniref:Uncharacterized protein n=1 Tax=Mycobacterium aquaticum TaxID=1927124 RepID=A0A1X0A506_9MYCO|nr:hypothetical protein [Mycobacterium aquaticum]ORA25173.1 hypothetical protein BST13_33160 [Mycobacterium aquaticum]
MTATKSHMLEDLALVLRKVLPVSNTMVDHYIASSEWDQAVLQGLATFDAEQVALPADVREMVNEMAYGSSVYHKVRKRALYHLDRIPVS